MSTAHTPGPWEVRLPFSTAARHPAYIVAGARSIADINGGVTYDELRASHANARLIAAAPCLLAALREIADDYADRFDMNSASTNPGMKYVVQQARTAIAKATGEAL